MSIGVICKKFIVINHIMSELVKMVFIVFLHSFGVGFYFVGIMSNLIDKIKNSAKYILIIMGGRKICRPTLD